MACFVLKLFARQLAECCLKPLLLYPRKASEGQLTPQHFVKNTLEVRQVGARTRFSLVVSFQRLQLFL